MAFSLTCPLVFVNEPPNEREIIDIRYTVSQAHCATGLHKLATSLRILLVL